MVGTMQVSRYRFVGDIKYNSDMGNQDILVERHRNRVNQFVLAMPTANHRQTNMCRHSFDSTRKLYDVAICIARDISTQTTKQQCGGGWHRLGATRNTTIVVSPGQNIFRCGVIRRTFGKVSPLMCYPTTHHVTQHKSNTLFKYTSHVT